MGERTWISLGAVVLALLVPAAARAASARVRALNAVASGSVTIQVDARPKATRLAPGRESLRFEVAAGTRTFTAVRGTRTVATRRIALAGGERVTVVYTTDDGHAELRLLREPSPATGTTMLRVANFSEDAGVVDVRVGGLVVARALDYNRAMVPRRVAAAVSLTGLATVTARLHAGGTLTAARPLVLATRSVGIFAIVPRGSGSRLLRLAYDPAPPTPTDAPAVTGRRRFGNAVRCDRGTWTPESAKVTRRWTLDGVDTGAAATFPLTTAAHAGHVIGCTVTATAKGMTTRARTLFTLPAVATPITLPYVGVPQSVGTRDDVSCNTGDWTASPGDFAIRWIRVADTTVLGTGPTFRLDLRQNGTQNSLACEVIATNDGGPSARARSSNTFALDIAPTVAIAPASKPADPTVSQDAFFTWAIGDGGADTVECSIDFAPFRDCIGSRAQTYDSTRISISDGGDLHTFSVRVTNPVSTATDTYAWTVRHLVTGLAVTPGDKNPTGPFVLTFALTDLSASAECRLDLGAFVRCTSPVTFPADPGAGSHTIIVRATNATGTDAQSIAWTFT